MVLTLEEFFERANSGGLGLDVCDVHFWWEEVKHNLHDHTALLLAQLCYLEFRTPLRRLGTDAFANTEVVCECRV